MRKHIRAMMRAEAERRGYKASRYVREAWDQREIRKRGRAIRLINKAKGTAPKRLWKQRIAALDL